MTILVELKPETEAWLAAQAAARSMDIPAYAARLLDVALQFDQATPRPVCESEIGITQTKSQRPRGGKSLAQLFAESPFRGLDMDFERDQDFGREVTL